MCPLGLKCKLKNFFKERKSLKNISFPDTFWARKLLEFPVPSFKKRKNPKTVWLIIKASVATIKLAQGLITPDEEPLPAFNLGVIPIWRKRGLPSLKDGPRGNFSGLSFYR